MMTSLITKLTQHKNLTEKDCEVAFANLLDNSNEKFSIEFLTLLTEKGETSTEIYAFVKMLRQSMQEIIVSKPTLDIVGTGGDGRNTINISSASALLVASLNLPVTKHGNRRVTSQCGSADFFDAMGIPTNLSADEINAELLKKNFVFLFGPTFHPTLQKISEIRKKITTRTIFNLLGPLLNPTNPSYYLLGVSNPNLMPAYAEILPKIGAKKALVVHSNGIDEISLLGSTKIIEINNDSVEKYEINPEDFSLPRCQLSDIQGGDSKLNKQLILDAFNGKPGPILDTLLINSGAALYAAEAVDSIAHGIIKARTQIENGGVIHYLKENFHV